MWRPIPILHIHVPQALVQLRHGQLQGRFQGIELGRRGVPGNQAPGRAELVLKYHHGKLRQGPVLAPEQVLETAGRNVGGPQYLRHPGIGQALFQKEPGRSRQDPALRVLAVVSACDKSSLQYFWSVLQL